MQRMMALCLMVILGCAAMGCGGPAAQLPDEPRVYDSNTDKVEIGNIGGSGLPQKGTRPASSSKAP